MKRQILGIISLMALPWLVLAHPQGEGPKPPQAAFDACVDKSEGEAVEFEVEGKTLEGTCQSQHGDMVAVPNNQERGRPPR